MGFFNEGFRDRLDSRKSSFMGFLIRQEEAGKPRMTAARLQYKGTKN
jgi:hypothetical protein